VINGAATSFNPPNAFETPLHNYLTTNNNKSFPCVTDIRSLEQSYLDKL
jgi:hypothetical protein